MFLAVDELDLALVTMGEDSVARVIVIQHKTINLTNIFHLILMHIISFDVYFLVGKT